METKTAYLLVDSTLDDLRKNYKSGMTFEVNDLTWMLTGSYTETATGLYSLEMVLVPQEEEEPVDSRTEVEKFIMVVEQFIMGGEGASDVLDSLVNEMSEKEPTQVDETYLTGEVGRMFWYGCMKRALNVMKSFETNYQEDYDFYKDVGVFKPKEGLDVK